MKAVILFIFLFSAGAESADLSPSETVFKYYEHLNKSEYKEAYEYISNNRKSAITEKEYVNHHINAPYKEVYAQLIEYKLIDEQITSNTATVKLKLKVPSFGAVLPILMSASHLAIYTLDGKKELSIYLKKQLDAINKKEAIPYEENDITIHMVKEAEGWKFDR